MNLAIMNRAPTPRQLVAQLLVLLALFAMAGLANAQILDQLEPITDQGAPALRILFSQPQQYLSHSPRQRGDEIQIELRPLLANDSGQILNRPERRNWNATPERPLREARYELLSASQARLTLSLKGDVSFDIRSAPDARSLIIRFPQPTGQAAKPTTAAGDYVINLMSSLDPITLPALPRFLDPDLHKLYLTRATIDGRTWNRLRLGFFSDQAAAEQVQQKLSQRYPQSWVARADTREIAAALQESRFVQESPGYTPSAEFDATRPPLAEGRAERLMEEARQAMATTDYDRAIQIYSKLLQHQGHAYHQDALEFLGLARERKHQLAHARAIYEDYLGRYPDGESADRVRQRLAVLTTASSAPQASRGADGGAADYPWEFYGGLSQFYRRDISVTDIDGNQVDQSTLATDLDITARHQGARWNSEARFTGGYDRDFLEEARHHSRLSSLYYDINDTEFDVAARIGRQTRSTGGVLGRFDGGLLSWQTLPWLRMNLVAGLPVNSTKDGLSPERYFYGISADLGTFANRWDFVAFMIEQRSGDLIDRRAVGGEVRYFEMNRSLLASVDYDIFYQELNSMLVLANWTLPSRTTLNATLDYRRSPLLTTTNALQGQTVTTLDLLQNSFTDDQIYGLAQDRTATSKTMTLGISQPVTEQYQVSGDVTVTDFSSTPTSGGVPGTPATGREYFYNAQLIGSSLIKEGDISILGLSVSDTSTARTTAVSLNTRYPVNHAWRLNPRLRFDYRDNANNTTQWTTRASFRSEYALRRLVRLEMELGGEWSTQELTTGSEDRSAYFAELGYRVDF